jgi:hypothetical protein
VGDVGRGLDRGSGWRNDPNNVCTCELTELKNNLKKHFGNGKMFNNKINFYLEILFKCKYQKQ